jgi:hypothetical protein
LCVPASLTVRLVETSNENGRLPPGGDKMITATDPTLTTALNKLKSIPTLKDKIFEMEKAGINVTIEPKVSDSSHTLATDATHYIVTIDSKADDAIAKANWGITGTDEGNSIAHELGHVYFGYLTDVKKKPIPSGPPKVPPDDWATILSEAMARRFDTYSRPKGIVIPVLGPPSTKERLLRWLGLSPL